MKKLRVIVLMHEDLIPPDSLDGYSEKEIMEWKVEFDVLAGLRELGHEVRPLGLRSDLGVVQQAIEEWHPHIAFNLLEEFHGVAVYDHHVVSYLELMRQPYTGCNPRGLLIAHDKALSKKILTFHRIPTPRFTVFPHGRSVKRPKRLEFPLVVKSATEHASLGISQASVVRSDDKLVERVEFVHRQVGTDALVEQYVEGRELYVGVIGNQRLETFPIWELVFTKPRENVPLIATEKAKWDPEFQQRRGVETGPAKDIPEAMQQQITRLCKRVYRALDLSGYARMDLRLTPDGRIHVLEANPNPNLEYGEDFAESAEKVKISYEMLLQRILNLGLRFQAPWKN